jgi:hypothetical protein
MPRYLFLPHMIIAASLEPGASIDPDWTGYLVVAAVKPPGLRGENASRSVEEFTL